MVTAIKSQRLERVQDLLAGWTEYVSGLEGEYPDGLTSEEIGAVYQDAGRLLERNYPDIESERDAICRFVNEKVLPLLLK